jgi:hypothetical protein
MPATTYNTSMAEGGRLGSILVRGGGDVTVGTLYSTTSLVYKQLDGQLQINVVIPRGFSLAVSAKGTCSIASGSNVKIAFGLLDISSYGNPTVAYDEQQLILTGSAVQQAFGLNYVWPGDNHEHNIILAFKTFDATHAAQALNDSLTHTPSLNVALVNSNLVPGVSSPWA